VDKPHNFYLNIAYGSGLFAFIALACLLMLHFYACCKLIRNSLNTKQRMNLAVFFAGWLAYLLQGMFNDSIIGTAPVFWILFGVSVSVLNKERQLTEPAEVCLGNGTGRKGSASC
jgi:O-antigen ligase